MNTAELRSDLDRQRSQGRQLLGGLVEQMSRILENDRQFLATLQRAEAAWLARVHMAEQPFDADFEATVLSSYREWETLARQHLHQLETLEALGYALPGAGEYRQALDQVQADLEEKSWARLGRRAIMRRRAGTAPRLLISEKCADAAIFPLGRAGEPLRLR